MLVASVAAATARRVDGDAPVHLALAELQRGRERAAGQHGDGRQRDGRDLDPAFHGSPEVVRLARWRGANAPTIVGTSLIGRKSEKRRFSVKETAQRKSASMPTQPRRASSASEKPAARRASTIERSARAGRCMARGELRVRLDRIEATRVAEPAEPAVADRDVADLVVQDAVDDRGAGRVAGAEQLRLDRRRGVEPARLERARHQRDARQHVAARAFGHLPQRRMRREVAVREAEPVQVVAQQREVQRLLARDAGPVAVERVGQCRRSARPHRAPGRSRSARCARSHGPARRGLRRCRRCAGGSAHAARRAGGPAVRGCRAARRSRAPDRPAGSRSSASAPAALRSGSRSSSRASARSRNVGFIGADFRRAVGLSRRRSRAAQHAHCRLGGRGTSIARPLHTANLE